MRWEITGWLRVEIPAQLKEADVVPDACRQYTVHEHTLMMEAVRIGTDTPGLKRFEF
jgi:hypothetical protein